MTDNKLTKLQTLYRILFSLTTAVVGLVFIMQLWGIYHSAPIHAFSRASIAKAFREISVLVWLWFVCFFLNIVISYVIPQEPAKLKGKADTAVLLTAMKKRFKENGKGVEGVQKQRIFRYVTLAVGLALIVFAALWAVSYLFDKNYEVNYTLEIFKSHNGLAARLISMTPWLLLGLLVGIAASFLVEYTRKKELSLLKAALADELRRKKAGEIFPSMLLEKGEEPVDNSVKAKWLAFCGKHEKGFARGLWILRGALCVIAIVSIILGIQWGGMDNVLSKARELCTQCIGLG